MSEERLLHVVAVGDVMIGRGVKAANVPDAAQLLEPELLRALEGDIVTGNLECLIGTKGIPNPASHSHFQGEAEFAQPLLEKFDVVTLANNHIGDFGDEAIEETLTWLEQIGVQSVGVGRSMSAAVEPAVFETPCGKLAVFGATTVGNLAKSSGYCLASPGQELYQRAREFIQTGHSCILHLHAGGGDVRYPAPSVRVLMQEILDAGFKMIFGHHPHNVQGFDVKPDSAVFFSLGDFVFDKMEGGRDQALVVTATLGVDGSPGIHSVRIAQRMPNLRVSLLSGPAHEAKLQELQALSDMINSGVSDKLYLEWRGNKVVRLWQSTRRDFEAGGWKALKAKFKRINKRKLVDLLFRR